MLLHSRFKAIRTIGHSMGDDGIDQERCQQQRDSSRLNSENERDAAHALGQDDGIGERRRQAQLGEKACGSRGREDEELQRIMRQEQDPEADAQQELLMRRAGQLLGFSADELNEARCRSGVRAATDTRR